MKIGKSEMLLMPNGNSYVWRYMSIQKFERLIDERALFFCNAKRLTDQYEVTIPNSTIQSWRSQLLADGHGQEYVEIELANRIDSWQAGAMKDLTLINCWSVSPYESYALWKIYLGNQPDGVAVRSTVSRLKSSIEFGGDPYSETVYLGKVRYRNHLRLDELTRFEIVTTKKTFYDFERELRLFVMNYPISEGGILPPYDIEVGRNVQVDLRRLIHRVYVSPFSNATLRNKVESLLKSSRLEVDCLNESEIRDKY